MYNSRIVRIFSIQVFVTKTGKTPQFVIGLLGKKIHRAEVVRPIREIYDDEAIF